MALSKQFLRKMLPFGWGFSAFPLTAITAAFLLSCSKPDKEDVDVHGNGLTRRAERILDIDPSTATNPLVLIPITTGEEPFTLTYNVPVQADLHSNGCRLVLMDNGKPAEAYVVTRQTNGGYVVDWGATFASFGHHTLQVALCMPFHTNVYGPTRIENVTNVIQFDVGGMSFGKKLCITGKLHMPSADYRIEIFDAKQILQKTIFGHTEKGTLNEVWDLRTTNNEVLKDQEFEAKIYITPTVQDSNGVIRSNSPTVRVPFP